MKNPDMLYENEFFEIVIKEINRLNELIIVSQTPVMFFEEEQIGVGKIYLENLKNRFLNSKLKTIYFMSEKKVEDKIYCFLDMKNNKVTDVQEKIKLLREWDQIWNDKQNISVYVVKKGCFPSSSFWIGKNNNKADFSMIKVNYENDKKEPKWLSIKGEIKNIDNFLNQLIKDSWSFHEYITINKENIDDKNFQET